ncbi:MAG: hypothetical protein HY807_03885 [Nitrospirae bacterium]|nr:hypothetical protein [Nitrospirota bacterium]
MKKIFSSYVYLGVILVYLGVSVIKNPKFAYYKYPELPIAIPGYNVPLGILLITAGILMILVYFLKKEEPKR